MDRHTGHLCLICALVIPASSGKNRLSFFCGPPPFLLPVWVMWELTLPTHGHVTQVWPISMAGSLRQWLVKDEHEISVHLRRVNPEDFAETIGKEL